LLAGALDLTSDGKRLFISDTGNSFTSFSDTNGPTIREVVLQSLNVTTMIEHRGQRSAMPGIGTNAYLNDPGTIAFDSATHSLILGDLFEMVIFRIH
jgi:hypothetical protein